MKKKIVIHFGFLFFLNAIILLSSCSYKKDHKNEKEVSIFALEGTTLNSNDSDFFYQIPICLQDSILYLASDKSDTFVSAYRLKEDSLILYDRFLSKGLGPYEITIFQSAYDKASRTLSFFENQGNLTKGYRIDLKEKNGIKDKATWEKFDFTKIENTKFGHGFFAYVSDSLLLTIGGRYNSRELLTLINLNDCISTYPLDFWPDDGFEENLLVKQAIYMDNSKLFKNNKLNKYLYVSGQGKHMEIFGIKDNQLIDRMPVCQTYIKYSVDSDNLNYRTENLDINRGFKVDVTDSLIYASPIEFTLDMIRSGQKNQEGYPCYYGKIIHVYDWNGNLLKKYETDVYFLTFIVDEKNNTLYISTDDLETGDAVIRKYKL